MTTVILSIIGILLAGLTALMVIYYGSTSYDEGTISAHASTLVNAGENVMSAEQLYYNTDGKGSVDLTELIDSTYLNDLPDVPNGTVQETYADLTDANGITKRAFVVTDVSDEVCLNIEKRVNNQSATAVTTTANRQIGCYDDGTTNTFYAKLV